MVDPYRMIVVNIIASSLLILLFMFYKFIFPRRNINPLFALILISILPTLSIFRVGTYESGDLTLHSVYLENFFENIKYGIFLPQWTAGLCGGYGCPIFLFEYSLPFYIGSFFHLLGFSYLNSMKLFLASFYIFSGITMYLLVRSELPKTAAFVAALLYLFAPFHLMETHFRVGVGSVASFVFVPLMFLFAKKSLEGKMHYVVLGGFNFLFLMLSHASVTFIIFLTSFIYAFIKRKNIKQMVYPILSAFLGLGLSAYYVLPALFEIKYSWLSTGISVEDFKPFFDYIYSPARFGLLFQGNNGEARFIVGYTQLFVVLFAIYTLIKNKIEKKYKPTVIFLLIFFFTCFILMQAFTKFIWNNVFLLQSFILPWRLLTPIAFATAYLGAYLVKAMKKRTIIILCILTVLLTILNWGNRKMIPPDPDAYNKQETMYTEYTDPNNPIYAQRSKDLTEKKIPFSQLISHRPSSPLEIIEGKGEVKEISRTPINHDYVVYAKTELELSENTYYFPGWKIYDNQHIISINITNKKHFGTLTFTLPKGLHHIQANFEDTPLRGTAKYISLSSVIISLLLLIISFIRARKSKVRK